MPYVEVWVEPENCDCSCDEFSTKELVEELERRGEGILPELGERLLEWSNCFPPHSDIACEMRRWARGLLPPIAVTADKLKKPELAA